MHPIYRFLTDKKNPKLGGAVKWNFQKYLVNHEGKVLAKFSPRENPMGAKVTAALDKAGVIHNDADPRNVMVDDTDGRWYLVDFGKARMREPGDGLNYNVKVTFTIMAVRTSQSPHW